MSELTSTIKSLLENRLSKVIVQGEISNCKLQASGHFYFDLKDAQAKIPAVLFRMNYPAHQAPKEGDQVILEGALTVYPPHGKYQIIVQKLQFAGIGELLLRFEELKKKLQARGWFDQDKKKPLPKFPVRIGVVTSPTGAVIRDIIQVLKRRFSGFHLILNPVRVQGKEASQEIALAIEQFNQHQLVDVLIVGRGGGSLEDLWSFNEERVAAAIYASTIPIVSAVGHESDTTLADFVADVRAPTPSAAAELVVSEKKRHLDVLIKQQKILQQLLSQQIRHIRLRLNHFLNHPFFSSSHALLGIPMQRVDEMRLQVDRSMKQFLVHLRTHLKEKQKAVLMGKPLNQIAHFKKSLLEYDRQLYLTQRNLLRQKREQLSQIVKQLENLDPKKVLKRGYSILFAQKSGSVIMSSQNLLPKMHVRALLSDGEAHLEVME